MTDSLIVASGQVTCPEHLTKDCTIIAGGRVVIPKKMVSVNVAIKEKQTVPLEALGFPLKKRRGSRSSEGSSPCLMVKKHWRFPSRGKTDAPETATLP
jgi:hypothetical protein